MLNLGDGKTAIGLTAEDGTQHEIRVVRLDWLRWWRYGLQGDQPYAWVDQAKAKMKAEHGIDINSDQAEALLLGLKAMTEKLAGERGAGSV